MDTLMGCAGGLAAATNKSTMTKTGCSQVTVFIEVGVTTSWVLGREAHPGIVGMIATLLGRAERSSPEARGGAPPLRRAGLTANARAER